jgi:serine/threonine protein kinase
VGWELAPGLQVLAHRGRDGDLDIYDCWNTSDSCCCLVKTVRADRLNSPARRRLQREARLLRSLRHPQLIRAYDVAETATSGSPLLVLEAVAEPTLNQQLLHLGPLPLADLVALGRQLCSALEYLHGHGYLHLGVESSTIVFDRQRARLIDLGSARRPGRITRGWGTSYQISPEQARGGRLTTAADVWGAGLVLYEAATRYRPFQRPPAYGTSSRVRFLQLTTTAPPVRLLRRLPTAFATIVDACLAIQPQDRPTLAELDACLARSTCVC